MYAGFVYVMIVTMAFASSVLRHYPLAQFVVMQHVLIALLVVTLSASPFEETWLGLYSSAIYFLAACLSILNFSGIIGGNYDAVYGLSVVVFVLFFLALLSAIYYFVAFAGTGRAHRSTPAPAPSSYVTAGMVAHPPSVVNMPDDKTSVWPPDMVPDILPVVFPHRPQATPSQNRIALTPRTRPLNNQGTIPGRTPATTGLPSLVGPGRMRITYDLPASIVPRSPRRNASPRRLSFPGEAVLPGAGVPFSSPGKGDLDETRDEWQQEAEVSVEYVYRDNYGDVPAYQARDMY